MLAAHGRYLLCRRKTRINSARFFAVLPKMLRQRLFDPGPAQFGHGDALLGGQLLESAVGAVRQLHDEAAQLLLFWCGRYEQVCPTP